MSKTETQIERVNRLRAARLVTEIREAIKELQDTSLTLRHAIGIKEVKITTQDCADLESLHRKARSILFIIRADNTMQY